MRSTLDYETPAPPSKSQRTWIGVLVVSAIGCGFVAWGIAASATQGPLPGELSTSSVLVAASLACSGLAIRRSLGRGRTIVSAVVVYAGLAGLLSGLAVWSLAHCRW